MERRPQDQEPPAGERQPGSGWVHPAARPVENLLEECDVRRQRRSGPGGQHRNKVETAVVITHLPSGIRGEASERRSQEENRQRALFRLRVNLALQVRTPVPVATGISPLWSRRCQGERIVVNPEHADFPALLAEALDAVTAAEMEVPLAANHLGCTTSQLIKFLAKEPRALEGVNQTRRAGGKSTYRY